MSIKSEHMSRSARTAPVADATTITDLRIDGKLPVALAGNYACIGLDRIDVVDVDRGTVSYRSREIRTGSVDVKLLAYGTSILAARDGTLPYELDVRLETVRSVDLAGSRRGIVADPQLDPDTGELHLVTSASAAHQLHVVVSRGA